MKKYKVKQTKGKKVERNKRNEKAPKSTKIKESKSSCKYTSFVLGGRKEENEDFSSWIRWTSITKREIKVLKEDERPQQAEQHRCFSVTSLSQQFFNRSFLLCVCQQTTKCAAGVSGWVTAEFSFRAPDPSSLDTLEQEELVSRPALPPGFLCGPAVLGLTRQTYSITETAPLFCRHRKNKRRALMRVQEAHLPDSLGPDPPWA